MIKKLFAMAFACAALGMASCSSDEPIAPDKDGKIFLYNGCKVDANTDFTMEQFTQELFSNPIWEEKTISTHRDGKWMNNLNAVDGLDGWTYQSCYEFVEEGFVNVYIWPDYDISLHRDTVRYEKERFSINMDEKTFTHTRTCFLCDSINKQTGEICGEVGDVSFVSKIVAVDKGRIIFDYTDKNGEVTRTSIEPYDEIFGIKKEIKLY